MKRLVPAVVLAAAVSLLSACGSSSPPSDPSGAGTPSASASASTGPAFDPCDGLDVTPVSAAFGSPLRLDTGTAQAPLCGLEPAGAKGPELKYTISYLWFAAGLDQAWKTFKAPKGAAVTEPAIAHADATRLVTYRAKKAYAVTAFVQTGKLIQEINGVALQPYDAGNVQAATKALMTALAAKAPRS